MTASGNIAYVVINSTTFPLIPDTLNGGVAAVGWVGFVLNPSGEIVTTTSNGQQTNGNVPISYGLTRKQIRDSLLNTGLASIQDNYADPISKVVIIN